MSKYDKEIRDTLYNILMYIGADIKYLEYAQLTTYLDQLLRNCGVKEEGDVFKS